MSSDSTSTLSSGRASHLDFRVILINPAIIKNFQNIKIKIIRISYIYAFFNYKIQDIS